MSGIKTAEGVLSAPEVVNPGALSVMIIQEGLYSDV